MRQWHINPRQKNILSIFALNELGYNVEFKLTWIFI